MSIAATKGRSFNRILREWTALLAGVTTLASVGGLFGGWIGTLDLLANFRLQYAALMFLAAAAAALARARLLTSVLGVLLVLHLVPLVGLVRDPDQPMGDGSALRIVQINVLTSNTKVEETASWLAKQDADVIVAQETNQQWAEGLDDGLDGWERLPTNSIRSDNFGMSVFVRSGTDVEATETMEAGAIPAIVVEIGIDGGETLMIYAVHTLPPASRASRARSREQLDRAANVLEGHSGPEILVGDLNTTRWAASYRRVTSRAELRDSADGFGLLGTWPTNLWFTAMIGIDHVLVSDDIRVEDRGIGPELGSDHRPVTVDLTIIN